MVIYTSDVHMMIHTYWLKIVDVQHYVTSTLEPLEHVECKCTCMPTRISPNLVATLAFEMLG